MDTPITGIFYSYLDIFFPKEFFLSYVYMYSETCLNRTSLGPTFVLRIDRCWIFTG